MTRTMRRTGREGAVFVRASRRGSSIVENAGSEQRIDWVMRQYVETIVQYLARGGDRANARTNMTERGVPVHVQDRVFQGHAAMQ